MSEKIFVVTWDMSNGICPGMGRVLFLSHKYSLVKRNWKSSISLEIIIINNNNN